jgi:hypothetical protein
VSALAAATEAYQAMREGHRHDPDNEDLFEDLLKARAEMETAWLEHRGQRRALGLARMRP